MQSITLGEKVDEIFEYHQYEAIGRNGLKALIRTGLQPFPPAPTMTILFGPWPSLKTRLVLSKKLAGKFYS
jgi:hypothetical protein